MWKIRDSLLYYCLLLIGIQHANAVETGHESSIKRNLNSLCEDTTDTFDVTKPDGTTVITGRTCAWVASLDFRCDFDGAAENCPVTCGVCVSQFPSLSPSTFLVSSLILLALKIWRIMVTMSEYMVSTVTMMNGCS